MLSDRSQSQKSMYYMIPPIWKPRRGKFTDRTYISGYLSLAVRLGEIVKIDRVSFWGDKKVIKLTITIGAYICKYTENL